MQQILLVEDDESLGFLLRENLEMNGFAITLCKDGEEAWKTFQSGSFDLCIIDIMLPRKDGFSLARQMRESGREIPFMFLTAKALEPDVLKGFENGCEDYVTKPFSARELLYRIKAILKRTQGRNKVSQPAGQLFCYGRLIFDPVNRYVKVGDEVKKLSTKENELLRVFAGNPDIPLHRSAILNTVWGDDNYFASKSMDVYLTRLRKILAISPEVEIQNIHGTGFRFITRSPSAPA